MKDIEYFKAGVELADGWSISISGVALPWEEDTIWPTDLLIKRQHVRAALAAQLTEQVDALDVTNLEVYNDGVYIGTDHDDNIIISGPDRTMNTLRAIVDSGVLGSE